jgi:hypothetical protein
MTGIGRRPLLVAVLVLCCSVLALAALQAQPRDGDDVAAIFPPWIDGSEAIGRIGAAGGALVRTGITESILVVHGEGADFAARLRQAGAWLVVDPVAFGGCLTGRS